MIKTRFELNFDAIVKALVRIETGTVKLQGGCQGKACGDMVDLIFSGSTTYVRDRWVKE